MYGVNCKLSSSPFQAYQYVAGINTVREIDMYCSYTTAKSTT